MLFRSDDEMFIVDFNKVLTITEIKNKNIISVYRRFNRSSSKIELTRKMGLVSKVDDARNFLENIYKSN